MKIFLKIGSIFTILLILASCTPQKPNENKLTVWHWMADRKGPFAELADKYRKETGIEVEFKLFFPPDIYSQKVIAAARANNLPDIFGILGEKRTLGSFIKAGHIEDLSSYMTAYSQEWKNRFYPQTLRLVIFNQNNNDEVPEGIYGVPIDTTIMQFIYNKTLLEKLGYEAPPKTFEDFITYAKRAKSELGVVGFACGWAEGWLLNALATEWAINIMGQDKFLRTIEGEVPYTDSDWLKLFGLFKELKDSGILAPNIATMTNKESEDVFARGKSLFSFNGSWSVNIYKQLNPDLNYGFFSLPKVLAENPVKIWGGAGSSFMVNADSANKEKAIDFLRWLTVKQQQKFLINKTFNLPSIQGCEDDMPLILKDMTIAFGNLTHPDIWPQNEDSRVIEVINRGLQQIVIGLKTPEGVAKEIENKKDKIMTK